MWRRPFTSCLAGVAAVLLAAAAGQAPAAVYLADSPAAQDLLDEARDLRDADRLTDAAARLQRLIERYPDRLMPTHTGVHEDALRRARRLLLDDEPLLDAYRQLHEVPAQRQFRRALEPQPVGAALEQIVARYSLTRTGLEAGLALAGYYLERADGRSAASVLDELADHPDLPGRAAAYHNLHAVAGLLAGDTSRAADHRRALAALDGDAELASLDRLARQLDPPYAPDRGVLHLPDVGELPESMEQPLWHADLDEVERDNMALRVQVGQSPGKLPVLPVADGRWLFVNEGERIRALDRSAGWTVWTYRFKPDQPEQAGEAVAVFRRVTPGVQQPATVLVGRDAVYAVVGQGTAHLGPWHDVTPATAIVSLDRDTGQPRWTRQPGELAATLRRGEFVGRVIAGSERVFALVRRSQNSGLTDTFVVAIDVGDGSLLWQRHIASTASGVRHEPAPPPRMSQANGRLYVSDNLAVVSALDQRRGTVLWTRVFERELDDLRRRPRVASPPAVDMPPILVDAGLLVPGLGDTGQGSVTLLDAATGQSRVIEPSDAFRDAERVLPAGDDVLVIGSTVRRLAGATLDPRWSVELPRTRRDVAGEPAVSARRLALPVEDAILFLDMDSGQVTGRIRLDEPANVTLLDGQAVAATAQTLRSYLSWDRAYADLRRQIDDARHDTRPGLALAELARRASRGEAVLEGADHALAALVRPPAADRDPARQRQLFDHLLELARDGTGLDTPTRQGLFDRIATVTAGPGQEVAYHLAVSRFLEHAGQAARAVDHLQAVLGEPTLAQQLYEQPLVARQAGLEARRRLARLVARLGPTIYDKYDRLARQRFDELTTPTTPATPAGDPGAQALIRLADRFPEAMVAPRARLAAAGALATEQQPAEAARQLRLAYDQARHRGDRAAAAGRLAELHEHQGRLELAAAWLRQVRQAEPELEPERDGQPVTIDAWLTELSGQRATAATGLPRLGLPLDEVQSMAGRPVPGHEGAALPADQFLLAGDGWLRLHAGPDREQAWEAELDMAEPRLLAAGAGQLLLWSPADRRLAAFDAETGESPWPTIDVRRAMGGADSLEDRKAARREQQRRFLELVEANNVLVRESQRPGQAGPHVHAGAAAIVLADADGQVVGVDRATGQVLWSRLADLDQVVAVAAGGQAFAIAGVTGTDDAAAAVVLLLDESTGEPLAGPLEAAEPAQWIGFAGPGLIVTAAEQQITAYRAQSGQVAWRLDVAGPALTDEAWADDNLLIIRDLDGRALVIEVETGDVVQRLTATQGRRPGDFQVTAAQGLWHIRTHEQVLALDARGKQVWRDAIDLPEAERFVHQLVTRDHVLVISEQGSDEQQVLLDRGVIRQEDIERLDRLDRQILEGQVGFDGSGHHRIYVLHRRGGGLLAEHELDPLPEPLSVERSLAVDGAVVLSYGDRTAVVAADPAPEADDEPVDEPADEPTEAADEPPADPAPPLSAAEGGGAPLPLAQEGSIQHK